MTDMVSVHDGDGEWVQLGQWFSEPEKVVAEPAKQPPPFQFPYFAVTAALAVISTVLALLLFTARQEISDLKAKQSTTMPDPQRRAQLEEIIHLANRSLRDVEGFNHPDRFHSAVVALENFQLLNSTWLLQNTNIQVLLTDANYDFMMAWDAINDAPKRAGDYPTFRIHRDNGLRELLKAVNKL